MLTMLKERSIMDKKIRLNLARLDDWFLCFSSCSWLFFFFKKIFVVCHWQHQQKGSQKKSFLKNIGLNIADRLPFQLLKPDRHTSVVVSHNPLTANNDRSYASYGAISTFEKKIVVITEMGAIRNSTRGMIWGIQTS